MTGSRIHPSSSARRGWSFAVLLVIALALGALAPSAAFALTIKGPRTATTSSVAFSVSLASSDPTGTVTVFRNGEVVAKVRGYPGRSTALRRIYFPLPRKYHLTASLESSPTPISAPEFDVVCYLQPGKGQLMNVVPGQWVGRSIPIEVRVDKATTYVVAYVNGRYEAQGNPYSDGTVNLGKVWNTASNVSIQIVTGNPGGKTSCTYRMGLVSYPPDWHTAIIISTEELKLYWIKDDVLKNRYPVATGRPSLPTPHAIWRIGEKYISSGVFGPRKMRLFRLRNGVYEYTAYNLHGTDTDSSIGTYASHGCIRMHNYDVLVLYPQVDIGTQVLTR